MQSGDGRNVRSRMEVVGEAPQSYGNSVIYLPPTNVYMISQFTTET